MFNSCVYACEVPVRKKTNAELYIIANIDILDRKWFQVEFGNEIE